MSTFEPECNFLAIEDRKGPPFPNFPFYRPRLRSGLIIIGSHQLRTPPSTGGFARRSRTKGRGVLKTHGPWGTIPHLRYRRKSHEKLGQCRTQFRSSARIQCRRMFPASTLAPGSEIYFTPPATQPGNHGSRSFLRDSLIVRWDQHHQRAQY